VDPNLVQLAAAYREAKAQLGDDAVLPADGDSADEADVSVGVDDIWGIAEDAHEGLSAGGEPLAPRGQAALSTSKQRTALPAVPPDSEQPEAKSQPVDGRSNGRSSGLLAHARRSPAGRAGPARSFTPADTFSGARPGYVFQTGSQGTGYYSDAVGAAAAARSRRMAVGAGQPPGDGQDNAPQDGSAAVNGDGNAERRGRRSVRNPDADDSDSEDDGATDGSRRGPGSGTGQKARGGRKSLPGRLRKKLAREREKHGSKVLN